MTLQINHPDFEKLALAVAAQTGETPTEAVLSSLRARLPEKSQRLAINKEEKLQKIKKLLDYVQTLPVMDFRTPDEILGYDANGLPT